MGEGGLAVVSFFGGLFNRRNLFRPDAPSLACERVVASTLGRDLATAYWSADRVAVITLVEGHASRKTMESEGQLCFALALVPAEQIDCMMASHRLSVKEAPVLD